MSKGNQVADYSFPFGDSRLPRDEFHVTLQRYSYGGHVRASPVQRTAYLAVAEELGPPCGSAGKSSARPGWSLGAWGVASSKPLEKGKNWLLLQLRQGISLLTALQAHIYLPASTCSVSTYADAKANSPASTILPFPPSNVQIFTSPTSNVRAQIPFRQTIHFPEAIQKYRQDGFRQELWQLWQEPLVGALPWPMTAELRNLPPEALPASQFHPTMAHHVIIAALELRLHPSRRAPFSIQRSSLVRLRTRWVAPSAPYRAPAVAKLTCGIQTQLPPDYIDLEKRVDALKQAHQKMLAVT